jgi:uncharacterized protein YyaL (SSP411 family)
MELALRAGRHAFDRLVHAGNVYRATMDGRDAKIAGFLEDHASLGLAALGLYEATFDRHWLERARVLAGTVPARFWDDGAGVLYDTPATQSDLIIRPRDVTDNALPSGSSLAAELLMRIATLTGDAEHMRTAVAVIETVSEQMARYPLAFGHMLVVADLAVNGAIEVALVGDDDGVRSLGRAVSAEFVPGLVLVAGSGSGDPDAIPLLNERRAVNGAATAFVCRGYSCDLPTTEPETLRQQLRTAAAA